MDGEGHPVADLDRTALALFAAIVFNVVVPSGLVIVAASLVVSRLYLWLRELG